MLCGRTLACTLGHRPPAIQLFDGLEDEVTHGCGNTKESVHTPIIEDAHYVVHGSPDRVVETNALENVYTLIYMVYICDQVICMCSDDYHKAQ